VNLLPDDTDATARALLRDAFRRMTVAEKLERVSQMTLAVQQLALFDVRRRHPQADAREQALRVASRWIPADLMQRAFGWDVRIRGY